MLRTFGAALALPPAWALAANGTSSAHGTWGYSPRVSTQSLSHLDRHWNAANESKMQARSSAEYMRRHFYGDRRP